ncbi:hypothetical protein VTK73DRAFT_4706 [Phialemonium thermophilum]|uniref:Uncharacterized protein n=1 Tax=Phialemonium thermophilum TaxID=223376 RepID=A0ABR3V6M1_9PEZI
MKRPRQPNCPACREPKYLCCSVLSYPFAAVYFGLATTYPFTILRSTLARLSLNSLRLQDPICQRAVLADLRRHARPHRPSLTWKIAVVFEFPWRPLEPSLEGDPLFKSWEPAGDAFLASRRTPERLILISPCRRISSPPSALAPSRRQASSRRHPASRRRHPGSRDRDDHSNNNKSSIHDNTAIPIHPTADLPFPRRARIRSLSSPLPPSHQLPRRRLRSRGRLSRPRGPFCPRTRPRARPTETTETTETTDGATLRWPRRTTSRWRRFPP